MNLDELKTAWKIYDRKLQSTQMINEKIISSMISDRTSSRFSKVSRQYILGFVWMLICLGFSIVVIFTNPFDYQQTIQYVPMLIFSMCLIILIGGMVKAYQALQKVTISHHNIDDSLKQIIAVYEKPKLFLHYTILVFLFSQIILFPLSFLPRNIERMGLWAALAEQLIPISIGGLLLFIAFKLGAFKERHVEKFKEDLNELQALKAMSRELAGEDVNGQ